MNREIKFRAWNGEKMLGSVTIETLHHTDACRDMVFYKWLQFTGLKDRNGAEIYEGDVLKIKEAVDRGDGYMDDMLVDVIFMNGSFMTNEPPHFPVNTLSDTLAGYDVCVVGNIYEDPELLN